MQNQKPRITIEVIESKEFRTAAKGYNQREVDEFLDAICDEMERMEAEMQAMKRDMEMTQQKLEQLNNAPAPQLSHATVVPQRTPAAEVPADSFREILEMAQRVKDQTIADAQAKAEQIVADAQDEIESRLGNLEAERDALSVQLETLKESARSYKAQFAALIKASQSALDLAEDL